MMMSRDVGVMGVQVPYWRDGLFFFCFCLERVMRRENSMILVHGREISNLFFSFSYLGWERRRRTLHQIVTTDTASAVL